MQFNLQLTDVFSVEYFSYLWTCSLLVAASFPTPWELHLTFCSLKGIWKPLFTVHNIPHLSLCPSPPLYATCSHLHVRVHFPQNCWCWLWWLNNRVLGLCLRRPDRLCFVFLNNLASLRDVKFKGFHSPLKYSSEEVIPGPADLRHRDVWPCHVRSN